MLRRLGGRRLRAGQTLLVTVTARRHIAERIAVTIRNGHKPSARLLR
jgi:predicted transcriptional regulator